MCHILFTRKWGSDSWDWAFLPVIMSVWFGELGMNWSSACVSEAGHGFFLWMGNCVIVDFWGKFCGWPCCLLNPTWTLASCHVGVILFWWWESLGPIWMWVSLTLSPTMVEIYLGFFPSLSFLGQNMGLVWKQYF